MKQLLLIISAFLLSFQFAAAQMDATGSMDESPTEAVIEMANAPAEILLLPNNQFRIVLPAPTPGGGVAVYDLLGNSMIYEPFGQREKIDLDLSQFKPGIYFVKVAQPNEMITKRIVVR